jgi:hypothetical protein
MTMRMRTSHTKLAPTARPYLVQIACGITWVPKYYTISQTTQWANSKFWTSDQYLSKGKNKCHWQYYSNNRMKHSVKKYRKCLQRSQWGKQKSQWLKQNRAQKISEKKVTYDALPINDFRIQNKKGIRVHECQLSERTLIWEAW